MAYKTFEDMKHDIPEGATHYNNEDCDNCFCWYKRDGGVNYLWSVGHFDYWYPLTSQCDMYSDIVKLIPQTETPEEKEALDMIDTASKQVESLANDSELPNGSEWDGEGLPPVGSECCFTPDNNLWGFASTDAYFGEVLKYEGEQFVFLLSHDKYNMRPCHLIVSRTDKGEFSKPESPEQKAERERLDLVKKACLTVRHDYGLMSESDRNFLEKAGLEWIKAFEKEGYRKEQK